jgi:hypothetical protein
MYVRNRVRMRLGLVLTLLKVFVALLPFCRRAPLVSFLVLTVVNARSYSGVFLLYS